MKSILKDIESLRREYSGVELDESRVSHDPIKQFQEWLQQALDAGIPDPHAMTLATVSSDGKPSARVVLLRGLDAEGFTFYTNYGSRKGVEVDRNSNVALVFFWHELDRQVRVEGKAERVDAAESDRYFASRPRASQIAARAWEQSALLPGRAALEEKFKELEKVFEGSAVPRPENWGGLIVRPTAIEFWQGRPSRLHDRIVYSLEDGNRWKISRLGP